MRALPQPESFGKYWLVHRLAAGGMAEIFKARYHVGGGIEKTCVIKRILPHLSTNDSFITMFHDEAKITVRLSHANIVQVFDFGRIGEEHFLAMEYVQGQNLQAILRRLFDRDSLLPVPIGLYIAGEIAKGLHYAHTRKDERGTSLGIIHRDVSPANVLVSYEGEVKLVDFGIAKASSQSEQTRTGVIKGKASYMAPEYLLGSPELDGRVDVFALGTVLWEILAGEKLFTGDNEMEIISKVPSMKITPPSAKDGRLPKVLDRVVMKALERDPSVRYHSAQDFYRDMAAVSQELGLATTSIDVGEYMQDLFSDEMEAEHQADREISRSFPHLTVRVTPHPVDLTHDVPEPTVDEGSVDEGTVDEPADSTNPQLFPGGLEGGLPEPNYVPPDPGPQVEVEATPRRIEATPIPGGPHTPGGAAFDPDDVPTTYTPLPHSIDAPADSLEPIGETTSEAVARPDVGATDLDAVLDANTAKEDTPPQSKPLSRREITEAAKRQAARNIKAGVFSPKKVAHGRTTFRVFLGLAVVLLGGLIFLLVAPQLGIDLSWLPFEVPGR